MKEKVVIMKDKFYVYRKCQHAINNGIFEKDRK